MSAIGSERRPLGRFSSGTCSPDLLFYFSVADSAPKICRLARLSALQKNNQDGKRATKLHSNDPMTILLILDDKF